jgi:hypothetical protein
MDESTNVNCRGRRENDLSRRPQRLIVKRTLCRSEYIDQMEGEAKSRKAPASRIFPRLEILCVSEMPLARRDYGDSARVSHGTTVAT